MSATKINYTNTHTRKNTYLTPYMLPLIPNIKITNTTKNNKRIATMIKNSNYTKYTITNQTIPIPNNVSNSTALALMVQKLTA